MDMWHDAETDPPKEGAERRSMGMIPLNELPPSKWDCVPPIDRMIFELHEAVNKVKERSGTPIVVMGTTLYGMVKAIRGENPTLCGFPAKCCKALGENQLIVTTEEDIEQSEFFRLEEM